MICFLVKMLHMLVLCPVLLATAVQTLTIDSQLGTSVEDCFERISIGEQLPSTAIYRNVSELTTQECETICKQDKQCQTYDYGVGAKGNATCNLSNLDEKELKENNLLRRHPDYDIYIRRFQCEQSPPTPLQPQFDDAGDGLLHRPVFRPEVDEKRPLADEYSGDFNTFLKPIPPYRPYNNQIDHERPDDYDNLKPDYSRPPSYGAHKPQDIPYKPQRPQSSQKPDPYDVLQFQDPYGRPQRPYYDHGHWRPDPHYPSSLADDIPDIYGQKPSRPTRPNDFRPDLYRPEEKPQYNYIIRPNRKPATQIPRPQEDSGYNKPSKPAHDYPTKPDPYGSELGHPTGPIGPPDRPYRPSRPHDYTYKPYERPSYSYHDQYASNYGQNSYNQDNSVYVEIHDPPRPYKPPKKPLNDRPQYGTAQGGYGQNYGYGSQGSFNYGSSFSSQNSYSQSQGSLSQYHGTGGSQNDDQSYQRPSSDSQRPSYGSHRPVPNDSPYESQSGYGSSSKPQDTYTKPSYTKPQDYPKPSYTSQGSYGYNQGYGSQSGYGSGQSGYGTSQSSHGSSQDYGSNQGSHGGTGSHGSKPGYGGNEGTLDSLGSYGYRPASYGGSQGSHDSSASHGNRPVSDSQSSYGGSQDSYASSGYGNRPSYGSSQGSYGSQGGIQSSYGNQGSYDSESFVNKPGYGSNQGSYGNSQGSYGSIQGAYGSSQGSYGSSQGSYGSSQGSYGSNQGSYGSNQGSYGSNQGSYNSGQINRPSYGNNQDYKPSYDRPSSNRPSYGTTPTYGQSTESSYGNRPSHGNQSYPGYDPDRPDVKPVYEYEIEKPGDVPSYIVRPDGQVITSKPVTISDYGGSGYGRDPQHAVSYKACFRRVLAGQRALRSHVRRVVPCETLEDCRRECAVERRFHCESFNYRLDPSFRGKGLCELMTKPIEAFDLRRDFVEDKGYDFYELDRNSLEPNCPESLRGPGLLHSGFLSSKPSNWAGYQNQWSDRYDGRDRYDRNWNRHYDDRRGIRNYGNRRYEDHPFVPYQIGLGRSNDDQENWGQYGGYYGGYDYYKDRNDYHKSINHWRLTSDERPYYGVRPYQNTNFNYHSLGRKIGLWENYGSTYGSYGSHYDWKRRWNTSGLESWNGLDYGESTYNKPTKTYYYEPAERSDDGKYKDCSSRRRPGMSLSSGAIRRALIARNVVECEAACFDEREFKCVSYSYRYSTSISTDNCFLSERPYRGLELSADSGSDVYAMSHEHGCDVSYRPWVESECFWHVRSGSAVSGGAVRNALTVAGLGACEAECLRARGFFCRGFSFRFDSPAIGDDLENCLLTSSPPTSLDIGHGLETVSGHELYARGNYGRGCEPALYDDVQKKEKQCYLQYDSAARLTPNAIRGRARVRDERACGRACTHAPFRCLSFSYNNNAPPESDNCLLSEIRLFDLQQGVDYEHSTDDWLFAFDLFNLQCWRKVYGKGEEPSPELPRPLAPPPEEIPSYPSGPVGPGYISADPPYIPGSGPPSGPGYKPIPGYPAEPGYKPGYPSEPGYKPGYPAEPGYKPEYPAEPGYQPGYPAEPGYKPGYPAEPGYKPGYPAEPGYKPGYPAEPGYKPGYPAEPGYKPGYPAEPAYKPGYPAEPGYKPGYPAEPGYKPGYPVGPDYKPGYPAEPGYKPSYPPSSYPDPYGPGYPAQPGYPDTDPGFKPGYPPPESNRPGYLPTNPSAPGRPGYPESGPERPGYPGDREDSVPTSVSWRHYTVSGFPCRQETSCAQNQVAGHWACEPEGGEIGSWDYCCSPTHRCGYSEGFHKPWCYVGPSEDQWRPCSEKYYPYHQHNIPHPSQGHRENHPRPNRPWYRPSGYQPDDKDRPVIGPYLSEADRKYWDDLYRNGPQAYYDKYGNPLPGYARVPTADRPQIKYHHNYPRPGGGHWVPVSSLSSQDDPPVPGGLGVPRYWPVAYLHKGPPPNMTYFRYNEISTTTTEKYDHTPPIEPPGERTPPEFKRVDIDLPNDNNLDNKKHRDEKTRNITNADKDIFQLNIDKINPTTPKLEKEKEKDPVDEVNEDKKVNSSERETVKAENVKEEKDDLKGIDGKLDDFSSSIEVLDIEDAKKGEKSADLKSLEAEERQIEAIGRLLASHRGGKLVLEKRSQKDLDAKSIAIDKDLVDFDFGNEFRTTERRGIIQKVSKDEIENERNKDRSLEVSETTFVRPPRVLSTTENIRKAIINGKIFYDATIREQRDIFANSSRKAKTRALEDSRAPSVINNTSFGKKKVIRARNVNPVRRVKRVYRKRYNPEEVRKRLLERERSKEAENKKV